MSGQLAPETDPGWQLLPSAVTRTGLGRAANQDAYVLLQDAGLYAVADGIGGLADGDVASRAIIDGLNRSVTPGAPLEVRVRQAEDALHDVNRVLFAAGDDRTPPVRMGSTIALVLLGEGVAVCLWAGDSRVYLQRGLDIHQLTHDHSLCLEEGGSIHPRNVLSRAIGPADAVEIDCCVVDIHPGDTLLMCTDGVSNWLTSGQFLVLLSGHPDGFADRLVDAAVAAGSRDDATAVTIRVRVAEGGA
ncbi:PP2C family protein-serine/threonine phosphatase [Xanthobacteraceae bacterium A53D]